MDPSATTIDASIDRATPVFHRIVIAAAIGNALEWYDILVYGFFATTIAKQFFPAAHSSASLLITLGTFGVAYLIRPIGALVLGAYADRRGRRASMLVSIGMMVLGTAMIALMPPYAAIGVAAPVGVVLARLIQGFSAGGEFGSTTAFLVDQAPERKGLIASFQFASQGLSYLLAAFFGTAITTWLDPAAIAAWGWRIPFLFGALIGPVGLYLRRHVRETRSVARGTAAQAPVAAVMAGQKLRLLLAMGALALSTGTAYVIIYIPTYAVRQLHMPARLGFEATILTGVILTLVTPLVGHVSDRIGRIRIMAAIAVVFVLTIYPIFGMLGARPGLGALLLVMAWLGLLKATYFGALPALMAEAFPDETRATGLAISYNIGVTLFGGFAPFIVATLVQLSGNKLAPAFYLMALGVISLLALWRCRTSLDLR